MRRSTLQLLRFHFSFFLLPVFLFALSQAGGIERTKAILVFFILHFLVYPSSNGYNSYMDRDETPIGGLKRPLAPTRQLLYVTLVMDVIAILLSLLVGPLFLLGILLYILASRAYSYRGIRLKKYPFAGFITVFIFQGGVIFLITITAVSTGGNTSALVIPCLISSLLIGALYPLTQIYQHEEDRADGVTTISYVAGKKGTFLLSMTLFLAATILLFIRFKEQDELLQFYLYIAIMLPVVSFFVYWMRKVWLDESEASFRNSMTMNVLSTMCTSAFFITLIILNH